MNRLFHPSNRNVRLLVGLFLAGLFLVQGTRSEAFKETVVVTFMDGRPVGKMAPALQDKVETLARTDHVALLELCLAGYQTRFQSYTCTFLKQERIGGNEGLEQETRVKFLDEPFSVAMKWVRNSHPLSDQVLYVEGRYNNQMLIKPKGLLASLVGTATRKADGPDAMKNTLRPINTFGFERSLNSLIEVYRVARSRGESTESFGGYCEVAGRPALLLVRVLPNRPDYPARRTHTYLDAEYLVPICVEGYDWENRRSSRYVFKDLKVNVGLTEDDFTPSANGMAEPG